MNLSSRWLLNQPELGLALVAGEAGLDRPLRFAHSIDLADPVPWLSGGELVLTTGAHLPERAADYVRGLDSAGVAALGFGVGLSHDTVPRSIVEVADELGLPVLEVPLPTPFAAVTKAVLDRLAELRYEEVLRVSRAQPRMTRAALRHGAGGIVRELSATTGAATVFLGPDKEVEATCSRAAPADVEEVVALAGTATGSAVVTEERAISVHAVGVGGSLHGWLAVVGEQSLGPAEQVLLGHAASLLALDKEKPRRLRAERNRLGATLLGLLLSDPALEPQLRSQLADVVDPATGIRVLVVRADDPEPVLSEIDGALTERDLPLLARESGGEAVVLLPGGFTGDQVTALSPALARAGLSGPHPLSALREALSEARLAAAAGEDHLTEFGSLAGGALLAAPGSRAVLDSVAEGTISKLHEHDPVLVTSLRAFLEANGQWETAAAAIGVHRHTLRNRLDRAADVLGCDLGSARVRAELLLAALAWDARPR
ncbi:PucR family transcriptional regulator [Amycolatopsis minnesotensis]|uniref:PucR family transcriptional regulator n=1 Tax=Amycolatopsis minnesotensis TaxID=337894 RepID=A0ABN2RQY8_9PSEU